MSNPETEKIMAKLQERWVQNRIEYCQRRLIKEGVRSSQLYALVDLLVEVGLLSEDHLQNLKR